MSFYQNVFKYSNMIDRLAQFSRVVVNLSMISVIGVYMVVLLKHLLSAPWVRGCKWVSVLSK